MNTVCEKNEFQGKIIYTIGMLENLPDNTYRIHYEGNGDFVFQFIEANRVSVILGEAKGEYLIFSRKGEEILFENLMKIYDTLVLHSNIGVYVAGKRWEYISDAFARLIFEKWAEDAILNMHFVKQLGIDEWLEKMENSNTYIYDNAISCCSCLIAIATPIFSGTKKYKEAGTEFKYVYRDGYTAGVVEFLNQWTEFLGDDTLKTCYRNYVAKTIAYLYDADTKVYYSDYDWYRIVEEMIEGMDRLDVAWAYNEKRFAKVSIRRDYLEWNKKQRLSKILEEWFYVNAGYPLDLSNPQTFNQKINWMKLYDNRPIKSVLSDKYRVREWIKEKIGNKYLVSLLGVWDRAEDIPFEDLPDKFVLKVNQGSGFNIVVQDKKELNIPAIRQQLNQWCDFDYYAIGLELQYKEIPPCIICEEYLENGGEGLHDYKIHVFNGVPKYIQYISGRNDKKKTSERFFNTNWEPQNFSYTNPMMDEIIDKPECLEEALEIAGKLAEEFAYVRVDLYILNDGSIKFGEMTFSPTNGMDPWKPIEMDEILGQMIDIDKLR